MNELINNNFIYPAYSYNGPDQQFILITSLNLGGAEKILSDQLWANHFNPRPTSFTVIVIYDKNKEHSLPPSVNVIRLHNNINNGISLFQFIASQNKQLVCHLLNDDLLNFLFKLNLKINLVIHNDQLGWSNKPHIFNHQNISNLISICKYVTKQIKQYTDKNVITIRHQVNFSKFLFDNQKRIHYRNLFNFSNSDIVIGMVGRIAPQKNYPKAIETLFHLCKINPNFKLLIVGGFQENQQEDYLYLCNLINYYNLQKNIIITGFRTDVADLINAFDLSLNTSYYEGLSIATQELMANGLSTFCLNISGQNEIFDNFNQIHFLKKHLLPIDIANTIIQFYNNNSLQRIHFNDDFIHQINKQSWASHRLWNLINYIPEDIPLSNNNFSFNNINYNLPNFAFLTSNLNLGGAQQSLINLLSHLKINKLPSQLIIANQSNEINLLNHLQSLAIPYFLPTDSIDVFDITKNILIYLKQHNINTLLFWNLDAKIKLLLTQTIGHIIKIIDVSPGNYDFENLLLEKSFFEATYYSHNDYFNHIHKLVFKYNIQPQDNPYHSITQNKTSIIPNGVYLDNINNVSLNDQNIINNIKQNITINSNNFIVCGRIAPSKHLDTIFDSIENINDISLHIVGSTDPSSTKYINYLHEKYSHLFNKKIFFYGKCDYSKHILPLFDALIVLGTHQGCPNIALESIASNIPVIANSSGGTNEIVNDNTGILIDQSISSHNLNKAIIHFIQNKSSFKLKSNHFQQFLNLNFSMDKMLSNYLNIIKN